MIVNINSIKEKTNKNVAFSASIRETKGIVIKLAQDSGSLVRPEARIIRENIENLSKDGNNAEFLIGIAEKTRYGVKKGSPLRNFIEKESNLKGGKTLFENDWHTILELAIRASLSKNTSPQKTGLKSRFENLQRPKNIISEEKKAVELRKKILNSPVYKKKLSSMSRKIGQFMEQEEFSSVREGIKAAFRKRDYKKIEEKLKQGGFKTGEKRNKANKLIDMLKEEKLISSAKENIDKFLITPELSINEKVKCLKLLDYMLSPEYKPHGQLKDKKPQILAELLNPRVSQTNHGMCAAISIDSNIIPEENRFVYFSNTLALLDDKPYIEVFDPTAPSKKYKVEKATDLNYEHAMQAGETILNTKVQNWMHIANAGINGQQSGKYTTSHDSYRMEHDSHWVNDIQDNELAAVKQSALRAAIKLKGVLKDIETQLAKKQDLGDNHKNIEQELIKTTKRAYYITENAIEAMIPGIKPEENRVLAQKLLEPGKAKRRISLKIQNIKNSGGDASGAEKELATLKTNEIHPKDADVVKARKMKAIINSDFLLVEGKKPENAISSIIGQYNSLESVREEDKKLNSIIREKFDYHENLFKMAAWYRNFKEFELQDPGRNRILSNQLGILPLDRNVSEKLAELSDKINSNEFSEEKQAELAEKFGVKPEELPKKIKELNVEVNEILPQKTNKLLSSIGVNDKKAKLIEAFQISQALIEQTEEEEILRDYAEIFDVKPLKTKESSAHKDTRVKTLKESINKQLNSYRQAVEEASSDSDLYRTGRYLSLGSDLELLSSNFEGKVMILQYPEYNTQENLQQISLDLNTSPDFESVTKALEKTGREINSIEDRYAEIAEMIDIPSDNELILKHLEDKGEIIPTSVLERLEKTFDENRKIRYEIDFPDEISSIRLNTNKFLKENKQIFKKIESQRSVIKRGINRAYKRLNKELDVYLSELYKQQAQQQGRFWQGEEGESGLNSAQQELLWGYMTGNHHRQESNPSTLLDLIGKGQIAQFNSMVSSEQLSGHAEALVDSRQVRVMDRKSGQVKTERAVFKNNSWGEREKSPRTNVHTDAAGNKRTDYGKGYGPTKEGFILKDDLTVGLTESDILESTSSHRMEYMFNDRMKGTDPLIGLEFPIFMDAFIEGKPVETAEEAEYLAQMILYNNLIDMKVDAVFDYLTMGNIPQVKKLKNTLTGAVLSVLNGEKDSRDIPATAGTEELIGRTFEESKLREALENNSLTREIYGIVSDKAFSQTMSPEKKSTFALDLTEILEKERKQPSKDRIKQLIDDAVNKYANLSGSVDREMVMQIDESANALSARIKGIIKGKTNKNDYYTDDKGLYQKLPQGVNSEEDLQKIPENHIVRKMIDRAAHIEALKASGRFRESSKSGDIEKLNEILRETYKEKLRETFSKTGFSVLGVLDKFQGELNKEIKKLEQEEGVNLDAVREADPMPFISRAGFFSGINSTPADKIEEEFNALQKDWLEDTGEIDKKTGEELNFIFARAVREEMNTLKKSQKLLGFEAMTEDKTVEAIKNSILNGIEEIEEQKCIEFEELKEKVNRIHFVPPDKLVYAEEDELDEIKEKAKNKSKSITLKDLELQLTSVIQEVFLKEIDDQPEIRKKLEERLMSALDNCIKEESSIKSVSELEKRPYGKNIVKWIDAKFSPKSDEEFMQVYTKLCLMNNTEFEKLLEETTDKDLGIELGEASTYNLVRRIKSSCGNAGKHLKDAAFYYMLDKTFEKIKENKKLSGRSDTTPELLYRSFCIKMSYINVNKILKQYKGQALEQHGARTGVPELKVYSDQELEKGLEKNIILIGTIAKGLAQLRRNLKNLPEDSQLRQQLKEEYGIQANNQQELMEKLQNLINTDIENLKQNLKANSMVFIKGNVIKKHQGKTFELLQDFIRQITRKEEDDEKTDDIYNQLMEQIIKAHASNNPKEFLDQIYEEIPKMDVGIPDLSFDDEKAATNPEEAWKLKDEAGSLGDKREINRAIINTWKTTFKDCLKTANNASIEFELIEHLNNARMASIADYMKTPGNLIFTNKETRKQFKLLSDEYLQNLFLSFYDETNNHSTLKALIKNLGIEQEAFDFLIKPGPADRIKFTKETIETIKRQPVKAKLLHEAFEEVIKNPKVVNGLRSIDSVFKQGEKEYNTELNKKINSLLFKRLHQEFLKKGLEEEFFDSYKRSLMTTISSIRLNNKNITGMDAIVEAHNLVKSEYQKVRQNFISGVKNNAFNTERRLKSLIAVDEIIPELSPLKEKAGQYITEYENAVESINAMIRNESAIL